MRDMGWVGEKESRRALSQCRVPMTLTSPSVLTFLALPAHQLCVDACSRTTVDITGLSQQDLVFLITVAPTRPSRRPSLSLQMYITRSTAYPMTSRIISNR